MDGVFKINHDLCAGITNNYQQRLHATNHEKTPFHHEKPVFRHVLIKIHNFCNYF
jgi:hypothetical protein